MNDDTTREEAIRIAEDNRRRRKEAERRNELADNDLRALRAECERQNNRIHGLLEDRREAREESERLRAALLKYGRHLGASCGYGETCSCGYAALLAPAATPAVTRSEPVKVRDESHDVARSPAPECKTPWHPEGPHEFDDEGLCKHCSWGPAVARSATREQVEGEIADWLDDKAKRDSRVWPRLDDCAVVIRSGAYRADQPQPSEPPRTEPADFERITAWNPRTRSFDETLVPAAGERLRQSEPALPVEVRLADERCRADVFVNGTLLCRVCRLGTDGIWLERPGPYPTGHGEVMGDSCAQVAILSTATPSPENAARARELLQEAKLRLDDLVGMSGGYTHARVVEALALLGGGDGGHV